MIELTIPLSGLNHYGLLIGLVVMFFIGFGFIAVGIGSKCGPLILCGMLLLAIAFIMWYIDTRTEVPPNGMIQHGPLLPELMSPADVWNMLMSWVSSTMSIIPVSVKFV